MFSIACGMSGDADASGSPIWKPITCKVPLEGEYRGLAHGKRPPLSLSLLIPNDDWKAQTLKTFDKRAKPERMFAVPILDWREGIDAGNDACLALKLFAAGEGHPPELFDFLEQELKAQLSFPILPPNVFARGEMHRTLGLTAHERLWDLRVRFTDFLRRFLACYRSDLHGSGRLTPDPVTVFFVRARIHHDSETSFHARSGLFGHRYFIDDGQRHFLDEQREQDSELPTEAIHSEYLPFPDGLCSWVYLTARSSAPTHVGSIIEGYEAIANAGQLKRLEQTFLNNRTLMEIPIYDDLPMLGNVVADGPSLILCIAIPNPDSCPRAKKTSPAVKYAKFLEPPELSSYRLAEEQVTREMAHRMTRRFLSPVVSSEVRESIGISPAMTKLKHEIEIMAPTKMPIILLGETGTGKTMLAKLIHLSSGRGQHRYRRLQVTSDELFPDELLGHAKGAFTGAEGDRPGELKLADKGTLLIDDIDKLSDKNQNLLRDVIEENKFRPQGATKEEVVDVRFIVASNQPLQQWVKDRKFREDLYHRLAGVTFELPPLRERRQDIPLWAERFLQTVSAENGRIVGLTPAAMERLVEHGWPGNLRQLHKVLERAVMCSLGSEIGPQDLIIDEPYKDTAAERSSPAAVGDALSVLCSFPGEYLEDKLHIAYGH